MSLQFADFNADGHQDIVTAVWEGTVFLVPGSKDGFGEPEHVKDGQDEFIILSRFYDIVGKEYVSADENNPTEHLVSAMAWDWDNDGDFDLILGAKDGQVYLRRNQGKAGSPKFETESTKLEAGGEPFSVPGGSTAPRTVDWDGDGLTDLVCGSFKGGAYWYRNVGKIGAPEFAKLVTLAKPGDAGSPETGWYVDPTDFDGDGDLDLVVGGYFTHHPESPELTAAQAKRLADIDAELPRLDKEWSSQFKAVRDEWPTTRIQEDADGWRKAYTAFNQKPEIQESNKKRADLRKEQLELRPRSSRKSGVWLYRRQGVLTESPKPGNGG